MFMVNSLDVLNLDKTLQKVVLELESVAGPGLYTSAYRPGDKGVHGEMPVRGIDRRCRDFSIGKALERYMNARWAYDPDRPMKPVVLYHKRHLHLQVCHKTERRYYAET